MIFKNLLYLALCSSLASCIAKVQPHEENSKPPLTEKTKQNTPKETASSELKEKQFQKALKKIVEENQYILAVLDANTRLEVLILEYAKALKTQSAQTSPLASEIYQVLKEETSLQAECITIGNLALVLMDLLAPSKNYEITYFEANEHIYFKKKGIHYAIKNDKKRIISQHKFEAMSLQASNVVLGESFKPYQEKETGSLLSYLVENPITSVLAFSSFFFGGYVLGSSQEVGQRRPGRTELCFIKGNFTTQLSTINGGGLQNLGLTCYANAAEQAMIVAWPKYFEECKAKCKPGEKNKIDLCKAHIALRDARLKKKVNSKLIINIFKPSEKARWWVHRRQSDVEEYMQKTMIAPFNPSYWFTHGWKKSAIRSVVHLTDKIKGDILNQKLPPEDGVLHILPLSIEEGKKDAVDMQHLIDNYSCKEEIKDPLTYALIDYLKEYGAELTSAEQTQLLDRLAIKTIQNHKGFPTTWHKFFSNKKYKKYKKFSLEKLLKLAERKWETEIKAALRRKGKLPIDLREFESFKAACLYIQKKTELQNQVLNPQGKIQGILSGYLHEAQDENTPDETIQGILSKHLKDHLTKVQIAILANKLIFRPKIKELDFPYTHSREVTNLQATGDRVIIQIKRFQRKNAKTVKRKNLITKAKCIKIGDKTFNLKATVLHSGSDSTASGHYVACGKENGVWRIFDDTSVRLVDGKPLEDNIAQSYLYFYVLDNPTN